MSREGASRKKSRWIRVRPGRRENLRAALAAGIGVESFYLTRLLLAREPLQGPPGPSPDGAGEPDGWPGGA